MAYYLNYSFFNGTKYIAVNIPASTSNTGRPLQIEWEVEFEARKNGTEFIIASDTAITTAVLFFIRTGSDFEFRSTSNANWLVTTGATTTNFTVYKIRSTFDGATRLQQLYINGSLVASRNPSTAAIPAVAAFFGLNNVSTRNGDFKYFKFTDFVTPANNRFYDANASGGTGTVLPDTINSANNGTQQGTWPANDSEWVFYSSGATNYTDTLLAGSYSHSGSLLNSSVGYSSALQAGSFAHGGSQLSSAVARSSILQAGSYTHSGSVLGSAVGYSSELQGGAFSYSGSELQSIIQNGAQNYSDTLLGGSFTHTGSTLQSAIARNSTLLAGSYSHAGSNITASLAFYSTLNGGSYSHFGSVLQSTVSGQVTVSIEGYTITFAADDVSGAFAADMVGGSYQSDYIEAIKWLI